MNPAAAMFELAVIVGSVRKGRFGPVVADWFVGQAKQRDDVSVDVIDLADTPIPSATFASRIGTADAFVIVTPEYNHGYPGPLKTAIDSVSREWRAKPVGFVCYGGLSGGLRAVEQPGTPGRLTPTAPDVRGSSCVPTIGGLHGARDPPR